MYFRPRTYVWKMSNDRKILIKYKHITNIKEKKKNLLVSILNYFLSQPEKPYALSNSVNTFNLLLYL